MGKIILYLSIIAIAILSFFIQSFEFILIALVILSLIFIVLAGIFRAFKRIKFQYFKIPILIIGVCLFGILVSLFRPYEKVILETGKPSEKLAYAYKTDQNDRKQLKSYLTYFSELEQRDKLRLAQVEKINTKNEIEKPTDKFYAAYIYHHSDQSSNYKIAYKLAEEAAKSNSLKDDYEAQWLRKATYDRYLVSIGKPQKYNTQDTFTFDIE